MGELLYEIGVEELPSGYIIPAAEALLKQTTASLKELGLDGADIKSYSTPRRLAVSVIGLPDRRPAKKVKQYGPPAKAAFGPDGKPTKAAEGFAKSKGVDISAITVENTGKGEYICVETEEGGERTADLLKDILPKMTLALPFPKSMIWGAGDTRFARPVRWIVSVFGGEVIPVEVAGVKAVNVTRGHRFMGSQAIPVTGRADYVAKLKENFVVADVEERRQMAAKAASAAAQSNGAELYSDDELAMTVTCLTEWPVALWGEFDREFLALPEELLIASMKNHQKMFAAKGAGGRITNGFVGVSNMKSKDESVVTAGYRRVLRARLSDAKFFFDEDRKKPLSHFNEKLGGVVWQKKLGTMGEKVERITTVAGQLADRVAPEAKPAAVRAAALCKADLATQMVYEFPELQGVMGREYARHEGEPEDVAVAIYEHYLPKGAQDSVPATHAGAIVAIADKIDTIVGCFGVGLIPTSAADPFALRRSTLGIIQISFGGRGEPFSLAGLIDSSIASYAGKLESKPDEVKTAVLDFFAGRLKNLWTGDGIPHDVADAVLAAGFDDLADANLKARAMAELKKREFFAPLAITFKRVANITKGHAAGDVDNGLFEKDIEGRLVHEIGKAGKEVAPLLTSKKYLDALERIASLRGVVDEFFIEVLVMAEDEKVRTNRLNILAKLSAQFLKIADFSRITAG
ncbi:MAG: glycine--tRNA ligase subunit beta [Nitrospinae bacterium]|nr:glycine--tRNA ligase subunit beta [Nitrospinota bacterium]